MEVKINKEIRNYSEAIFFGLSMRQCIFSVLAVGVAVALYFILKPYVGTETVSWVCILGAAPFAALGFVSYHGMTAEQFLWAWFRSEILEPKRLYAQPSNFYYNVLQDSIADHEREMFGKKVKPRTPEQKHQQPPIETTKKNRRHRKEAKHHA